MTRRRDFALRIVPLAGVLAGLPRVVLANLPALTEDDKMAVALGFRLETEKAPQEKYPKHTNDQTCARCLHFTAPDSDTARCDLFNKLVPRRAWCSGFSRRP
jgi:hypothetical protein